MTAAIFFEGGLIQLLLGGAFLLFTRRFLGLVRIHVVSSNEATSAFTFVVLLLLPDGGAATSRWSGPRKLDCDQHKPT